MNRITFNIIKRNFSQTTRLNYLPKLSATLIILDAKNETNLKFSDLANKLNVNKVWLTSAILGQHPINEQMSRQLINILNIKLSDKEMNDLIKTLGRIPNNRGLHYPSMTTRDPTVRRFNELLDIYGDAFKELIREEFGDGIMSAIDCTINFDKKIIEKGEERVVITIDGKYLQYKNE